VEANITAGLAVPSQANAVVDDFGGNWRAERIALRTAHDWDGLPPLAKLAFGASREEVDLHLELSLKRDLEAYRTDPLHGNWVGGFGEVDINVPHEGWLSVGTRAGKFKVGRFPWRFGDVPHGVILAGAPRHDGVLWELGVGRVRYSFLGSSLNPWLNGTPTDSLGRVAGSESALVGRAPTGSEAWQQSHHALGDQHGRIYDDPSKTLFAHALEWKIGLVELAVIEQTLVGGKSPGFRDLNPFVLWHDNYGDGYSRSFFSFQGKVSDRGTGQMWFQVATQLIKSPVEGEDNYDPPTQMAVATGWSKRWFLPKGILSAHQEFAATTPTYDNHLLPLLKMTSRRVYRSNVRDQADPGYADNFQVDDPLGYGRGPDACDLWSRVDWQEAQDSWSLGIGVDWLQQGDADLSRPVTAFENRTWPLSGTVERELAIRVHGSLPVDGFMDVWTSAGTSILWNRNHVAGNDGIWPLASLGMHVRY
jgi:hypothetical protein